MKQGTPPHTPTQALNNMAAHIAKTSSISRDARNDVQHEMHILRYLQDHVRDSPAMLQAPHFTLTDVVKACTSFRLNTALGPDNISPYFLRYGGKTLHKVLFHLFAICSWYGVVPTSFRHGHVMSLYKGEGQATDPNNTDPSQSHRS